jgi:Amt family ammonium transporter
MKLISLKGLAGLALAAGMAFAPLAPALAQNAAPAEAAAAAPAAAPAEAAPAAAPAEAAPAAAPAPKLDSGDTAWMLTSTALVLLMTIPGLALFYGGMVRKKNVIATVAQSFAITCLISVLWLVVGYTLSFTANPSDGMNKYIGGMGSAMMHGMSMTSTNSLAATIPESVFMMFQMTFAIITPALICGAYAERMKFSALLLFTTLWSLLVYVPIAHMVWGGGILGGLGVLDFAGGTVVHINAGVSGLVCA